MVVNIPGGANRTTGYHFLNGTKNEIQNSREQGLKT
jgi:hypothetical protein